MNSTLIQKRFVNLKSKGEKETSLFLLLVASVTLLRFLVSFSPQTTFYQDPVSPFVGFSCLVLFFWLKLGGRLRAINHIFISLIVFLGGYFFLNYTLNPIVLVWSILVPVVAFSLLKRDHAVFYCFALFIFGISQFFLGAVHRADWYLFISSHIVEAFAIISLYFSRRYESEALAALQRLALIVDTSQDAILSVSTKGSVLSWNRGAEELFGYTQKEMLDKSLKAIIPKSKSFEIDEMLVRINKGEQIDRLKTKRITKNGEEIDVLLSVSVIKDRFDVIEGASIILRDITEEVMIDKAKTEFVSLASHQLRSPLTASKWNAELLLNSDLGSLNEDQREAVMEIVNINKKMDTLVTSLLNVSRIDLGRFAVEPEEVDMKELVDSEIKEVMHEVAKKELVLETHYSEAIPSSLSLDPQLVRICVQNFLTNAIKYNVVNGKIIVRLLIAGDMFRFEVEDTGIGIAPKNKRRIFTKLYRAENALEEKKDGNGLGLYIVKAIVEQSSGSVGFESRLDLGSTFYFELPLSGMRPVDGAHPLE